MEIEDHYSQLPWEISSVALNINEQEVDIIIEYDDDSGLCPECNTISQGNRA